MQKVSKLTAKTYSAFGSYRAVPLISVGGETSVKPQTSSKTTAPQLSTTMVILHAVLMIVAWGFLLPFGTVVAALLKTKLGDRFVPVLSFDRSFRITPIDT
jgi:hypothetical protein